MPINYVQRPFTITTSGSSSSTLTQESGSTADGRIVVAQTVTDDGAGAFIGGLGTVNYGAKQVNLRVVKFDRSTESYKSDYDNATEFGNTVGDGSGSSNADSRRGASYGTTSVGEQILATSSVVARYRVAPAVVTARTDSFAPQSIVIDLCPYTSDSIVPGSVQFVWMGQTYTDFEGVIYRDRTGSNPGINSGRIDYAAGTVRMTDYVVGPDPEAITLQSLWTRRSAWKTASMFMRTQAAPIKPTGYVLTLTDSAGNALTATGDLNGNLLGAHMWGHIDYQTGVVELQFGDFILDASLTAAQKAEWWYDAADVGAVEAGKIWRPWPVDPSTLRYNSVSYFYLPIDADILGLDPVRLPQDGRVPIFRVGSYVVIGHSASTPPATLTNGQTVNCARTRLSRVRLVGSNGNTIHTGYTADLDAGTVTATDVSGWSQPVRIEHHVEQLGRLRDVQINGDLALVGQLSHDFPAGSVVSSAITATTLRARVAALWDQWTWDGISWLDTIDGNPAVATYDDTLAPIELTNAGALTERFALRFTSSTAFQCIGEHLGVIGTGTINADFSPVNPVSGQPYFTLRALGWGSGWAAGNVLFIHLVGAISPFACIRTVQMGPPAGTDYSFELLGRGDVDRPPSAP